MQIETGLASELKSAALIKLARHFGVTTDYLYDLDGPAHMSVCRLISGYGIDESLLRPVPTRILDGSLISHVLQPRRQPFSVNFTDRGAECA